MIGNWVGIGSLSRFEMARFVWFRRRVRAGIVSPSL